MKFSQTLIPTLKETPAEAEVISHKLMVRAGYIRKLAAGVYTYLPLALRVLRKIENIIREEMFDHGAEELLLPIVMPAELWQETGRWNYYGKELLRFKDRHDRDFCIGPTHEEAITNLVRAEIKSYRDLPKNLFQIQTKFRDEVRPRFGLMRGREFLMKDGYSFDVNEEGTHTSYQKMYQAYTNIFTRCGLEFRSVDAATGNIGGLMSQEFQVIADSGEDAIFFCNSCDYAANVERARTISDDDLLDINKKLKGACGKKAYVEIETPEKKTIEEVSEFLKLSPSELVKTLLYRISLDDDSKKYIGVLVRGDHEIVEDKLIRALFDCQFISSMDVTLELALEKEVKDLTGAEVGFAGPVGISDDVTIFADSAVHDLKSFVTGANKNDMHFKDVCWQDLKIQKFLDVRRAGLGDPCTKKGCNGTLEEKRGIEVGQIFFLGTKYSKSMNATYLDKDGKEALMVMGTYGIGVSRTSAAAIEQNHDDRGIVWPFPIAPYHCHLIDLSGKDDRIKAHSSEVYCKLLKSGIEVLFDDRNARPGVKFADADLIGMPYQVIIGKKAFEEKIIEVKERKTQKKYTVSLEEFISKLQEEINGCKKNASA